MSGRKGIFIWFAQTKFDPDEMRYFEEESDFLDFINSHASEDEFRFHAVRGAEIEVEAVNVVKEYRIK